MSGPEGLFKPKPGEAGAAREKFPKSHGEPANYNEAPLSPEKAEILSRLFGEFKKELKRFVSDYKQGIYVEELQEEIRKANAHPYPNVVSTLNQFDSFVKNGRYTNLEEAVWMSLDEFKNMLESPEEADDQSDEAVQEEDPQKMEAHASFYEKASRDIKDSPEVDERFMPIVPVYVALGRLAQVDMDLYS